MNLNNRSTVVAAALGFVVIAAMVFGLVHVFDDGSETGIASWYGPGFHGRKTASGTRYNQNAMTAASRTLPLGTKVLVTNLENDRKVEVTINDRGPYVDDRIIDLSRAAARKLGMLKHGTARVRIDVIEPHKMADK